MTVDEQDELIIKHNILIGNFFNWMYNLHFRNFQSVVQFYKKTEPPTQTRKDCRWIYKKKKINKKNWKMLELGFILQSYPGQSKLNMHFSKLSSSVSPICLWDHFSNDALSNWRSMLRGHAFFSPTKKDLSAYRGTCLDQVFISFPVPETDSWSHAVQV